MRVLFVIEPFVVEPLGIAYLASALKNHGHTVDLLKIDNNGWLERVGEFAPDVVAYSVTTGKHKKFLEINRQIKNRYKVKSVFGGAHPTYFPEMKHEKGVDYIIRGEGDHSFPSLINRLAHEEPVEKEEKPHCLEQDLDKLPNPDRAFLYKYAENFDNPIKNVLMSRGCKFSCPYCFNSLYKGIYKGQNFVRYRSPDAVINEILEMKKDFPLSFLFFQDDEVLSNPHFDEFFDKYSYRVRTPFHVQLRIELLTHLKAKKLKEAGCTGVTFAVECGNETQRKLLLKRNMTNEQIITGAEILHRYDLKFRTENMVGLPGETLPMMYDTIKLNQRLNPTLAWASIFQPYPRLPLGLKATQMGLWHGEDAFSESFFESTILRVPFKKEIVNIQRLFGFFVKNQVPELVFKNLIKLPMNKGFDRLYHSFKQKQYEELFK
jgi:anaerobic magnesium-protoporphyrin IX monomethyl ester cyclase